MFRSPTNLKSQVEQKTNDVLNNRIPAATITGNTEEVEAMEALRKELPAERAHTQQLSKDYEMRREQLEEMCKDNAQLRQRNEELVKENKQQKETLQANPRQGPAPPVEAVPQVINENVDNSSVLIRGLANSLPFMNVNPRVPTFTEKTNPKQYLEEIRNYLKIKNIPEGFTLIMVENILAPHIKTWYQTNAGIITSFEDFENKFLEKYYSVPVRVAWKTAWLMRTYDGSDGTMQEYFYDQHNRAKYFDPLLSTYEINFSILQQMPMSIIVATSAVNFSDSAMAVQTLAQLDIAYAKAKQQLNRGNGSQATSEEIFPGLWNSFEHIANNQTQGFTPFVNTHQKPPNNHQNNPSRFRGNQENGGYRSHTNARTNNIQISSEMIFPDVTKPPPPIPTKRTVDCDVIEARDVVMQTNSELIRSATCNLNHITTGDKFSSDVTDFIEDIRDEFRVGDKNVYSPVSMIHSCPHLVIKIGNIKVDALLDTGSEISAISEEFFKILKSDTTLNVLPVSGMQLTLAVSKKATLVKHQAFLSMLVDNIEINHQVLIVPGLNQQMLLGSDWCRMNQVSINYSDQSIVVQGVGVAKGAMSFERGTSDRINKISLSDIQCHTLKIQNTDDDDIINLKNDLGTEVSGSVAVLAAPRLEFPDPVRHLIQKYEPLFSDKPGCVSIYEHKIVVNQKEAIVRKSYPVPLALRSAVDEEVKRMLDMGVIERSNSPFCNPLRIVKKKDESLRLCLDARFTNGIIDGDNESPPPINEIMQKFNGAKIFSTVDLTTSYWQIPLEQSSRKYTAFLNGSTLYQFTRIPFGLKTAGSGFIRALNLALGNDFNDFLTYYIDDLLIASKNERDHIRHLDMVFERLLNFNFTVKLGKARFCQTEVPFLGFILSTEGIRPEENKLRVLRKDKPWDWNSTHDQAYIDLKQNFIEAIQLSHYDLTKPFRLQTDGSDTGIGGVLYQVDEEGNHKVISMVSRCLSQAESHYTTTEKELLAVVYSVDKLRVYLIGREFTLITDHHALTFLLTSPFHTSRLARWNLSLQEFNFTIEHCRGVDNIVADFLSRNPEGKFQVQKSVKFTLSKMLCCDNGQSSLSISSVLVSMKHLELQKDWRSHLKEIRKFQTADKECIELMEHIASTDNGDLVHEHHGIWFIKERKSEIWRLVIPRALQELVVTSEHERFGHFGVFKTLSQIRKNFWWKNMGKEVKRVVLSCDLCQRTKHVNRVLEGPFCHVRTENPSELATVDFYGPLPRSVAGVEYIFVVLDAFSKLVKLYPIKRANTRTVLKKNS